MTTTTTYTTATIIEVATKWGAPSCKALDVLADAIVSATNEETVRSLILVAAAMCSAPPCGTSCRIELTSLVLG